MFNRLPVSSIVRINLVETDNNGGVFLTFLDLFVYFCLNSFHGLYFFLSLPLEVDLLYGSNVCHMRTGAAMSA